MYKISSPMKSFRLNQDTAYMAAEYKITDTVQKSYFA